MEDEWSILDIPLSDCYIMCKLLKLGIYEIYLIFDVDESLEGIMKYSIEIFSENKHGCAIYLIEHITSNDMLKNIIDVTEYSIATGNTFFIESLYQESYGRNLLVNVFEDMKTITRW